MGRKKLQRLLSNVIASNVIESSKEIFQNVKGKWRELYFNNSNPIVLELACGKGEYSVGLAEVFPNKNFIGIDLKGDRLAVGSKNAIAKGLQNVAFLRTNIYFLDNFFEENEVDEIWITFPDPYDIKDRANRRLTNQVYLEKYKLLLKDLGFFHLKTDSQVLFDFTIEELDKFGVKDLQTTKDLYQSELNLLHYNIKTKFEEVFTKKGFSICYLQCRFANRVG